MWWTALLLGLGGSLHCVGMCGPLVMMLPHPGGGLRGHVFSRLLYQGARICSYMALGALAGGVGASASFLSLQRVISLAAGLLILSTLVGARWDFLAQPVNQLLHRLRGSFRRLSGRNSFRAFLGFGAINGFLPCGLSYAAAASAAASSSSPVEGSLHMLVFGLGTLPVMTAVSLFGNLLPGRWRILLHQATPWTLGLVGAWLVVRGLGFAPFCSSSGGHCCPR